MLKQMAVLPELIKSLAKVSNCFSKNKVNSFEDSCKMHLMYLNEESKKVNSFEDSCKRSFMYLNKGSKKVKLTHLKTHVRGISCILMREVSLSVLELKGKLLNLTSFCYKFILKTSEWISHII